MAASLSTSLSPEEENYVRMSLLLTGIAPLAVRIYFDKEFHPDCLDTSFKKETYKLSDLKVKKKLSTTQWDLLFPDYPDVPDSKTFDITLMITLLRNLTPMIPPHGGYNDLPAANETTPPADLVRIKYYRNYVAHLESGKIGTEMFNKAWTSITESIGRLGGEQMILECSKLKDKNLDQTNYELMVKSNDEIKMLKESFGAFVFSQKEMIEAHEDLTSKVKTLMNASVDKIPSAVRDFHQEEVKRWQLADNDFGTTTASKRLFKSISKQDTGLISVVGPRGCGKSFLTKHVALQMKDEHGYEIIPVQEVREVIEYNQSNLRQLFVFDDVCSSLLLLDQKVHEWKTYSAAIQRRLGDKALKIIVCCATDIYEDPKFQEIRLPCEQKFDFKADDNMLSDDDIESIATCYMKKEEVVAIKDMKEKLKKLDNFPLLCRQFADEKLENSSRFFAENISVISHDTKVENTNMQMESNTSNSVTMNPEQLVQGLLSRAKLINCPINFTFNTHNHYDHK